MAIKPAILEYLNDVARATATHIFFLKPKNSVADTASLNGALDKTLDERFRIAIYGDMDSSEHAKTRVLIMIDQIVRLISPQSEAAKSHC